ncbi:hypothetical protein LLG95_00075 [bacterium]|nr:hypothetical protein [bacterium]
MEMMGIMGIMGIKGVDPFSKIVSEIPRCWREANRWLKPLDEKPAKAGYEKTIANATTG